MKIAVSQRLIENQSYSETRDALDIQWARVFDALGWDMFPIPTGVRDPSRWLETLCPQGLLLSGGNDLSVFCKDPLSLMRDRFEEQLVTVAIAKQMPVLGVCRGAQFLAQFFGAELGKADGHIACRHKLQVQKEHELSHLFTEVQDVNSFHSTVIHTVSKALKPLAMAPDATIEAFTHTTHSVLGLMWHPEREAELGAVDRALMETVFQSRLA